MGDIPRLREARQRQNEKYLVNQYRSGESAVVEAELRSNLNTVLIRRSGRAVGRGGTQLEWSEGGRVLRGDDAEDRLAQYLLGDHRATLAQQFLSAGMLEQDAMRSVLETKPAERYGLLRQMLGLGTVEDFEEQAVRASQEAAAASKAAALEADRARALLQEVLDRAETLERRLVASQQTEEALSTLVLAAQRCGLALPDPMDAQSVPPFGALAGEIAGRIRRLAPEKGLAERELQAATHPVAPARLEQLDEEMRREREVRESLHGEQRGLQAQLRDAEAESSAFERLVASAIPLLTDHCPVCLQRINSADVRNRLTASAQDAQRLDEIRTQLERVSRMLEESEGT